MPKFRTFYPKTFFQRTFLAVTIWINIILIGHKLRASFLIIPLFKILGFQCASRPSSILTLNWCSVIIFFSWILKNQNTFLRPIFLILTIHKPSLWRPTKNLGPIGWAVLTFIGYKQTNRQIDKPSLYMNEMENDLALYNMSMTVLKWFAVYWPKKNVF